MHYSETKVKIKLLENLINQHIYCDFMQSDCLNLMLKVSFFYDRGLPMQSLPPLVDSCVSDTLIKVAPFFN